MIYHHASIGMPFGWSNYAYHPLAPGYSYYEPIQDEYEYEYEEEIFVERFEPAYNLQANEPTLNCLKWLLVDQKDVDLEIKSPPHVEEVEYASSDEDTWAPVPQTNPLGPCTEKKKPILINLTCEWQRCNAQFACTIEYRDHIDAHFEELARTTYKEYHCEWDLCGFKANNVAMFERHVKHHEMHGRFLSAGESMEIMNNVPKCNLAGLDRNRLPELLQDFTCGWSGCSETFRALSRLHDHVMDHLKDAEWNGEALECKWRGCSFGVRKYLRTHVEQSHVPVLMFACRKCGHTRKSKSTFLGHFLSQASIKVPALCCRHCNQQFSDPRFLKSHLKSRHQAFACSLCSLNFMGSTQLRIHVANVHVKLRPFKCSECPKAFESKNNLRTHMHTHNKEENGYQCPSCDYKNSSYLALRKHNYQEHMGRKFPYECHVCGTQFDKSDKLGFHLKKAHQVGVPKGFHRYTYVLEDGPVFRLKMEKTYEGQVVRGSKPQKPLPKIEDMEPVTYKVNVQVEQKFVKVNLEAVAINPDELESQVESIKAEPTTGDAGPRLTRAARKLLSASN